MTIASSQRPHIIDDQATFATLELAVRLPMPHDRRSEALQSVYTDILLAGAGPHDRAAFLDALGNIGASLSIGASDGILTIRLRSRTEVLRKALTLLAYLIEEPRFAPKELIRIKKRLVEELKLDKEDAKARAYQGFVTALVPPTDPRYEYDLDTVREEAGKVAIGDVRKLHRALRAAPARYACGGTDTACRAIETTLRRLGFGLETPFAPVETRATMPIDGRRVTLVDIPHRSNIEFEMGAGVPILRNDPAFAALHFGMSVLGLRGGFAGRLMSIVREKEGLTYGIYGQIEGVRRTEQGLWRIGTFFAPKDAATGISSTLREIARIRTEGITQDELGRFKQILATRFALTEDSLLKRVSERLAIEILGLTPEGYQAYKDEIRDMTRDRVNAALRTFIDPERMVISGAGPVSSVAAELKGFSLPKRS